MSIFIPILFTFTIASTPMYATVAAFSPVPITQETHPVAESEEQKKGNEVTSENNDNSANDTTTEEARKNHELFIPKELSKKRLETIQDSNMFLISTKESGKRIEIIHAKDVSPSITLVSPDGSIYADTNAQSAVIIKTDIAIQAYSPLVYSVVYLPQTPDGHWKLSVTGAQGTNELIVVSSKHSGSTAQSLEKLMYPDELIAWYLSDTSIYTEESLVDITAEEIQNGLQPVKPKDDAPEDESTNAGTIAFVSLILCVALFFLYRKAQKAKEKNAEKKREERVRAANEAMKEKQAHENEELAEIIAAHESEYIDYPEEVDYRKWKPEDTTDTSYEEKKEAGTEGEGQQPQKTPIPQAESTTPHQPFVPDNSSIFF